MSSKSVHNADRIQASDDVTVSTPTGAAQRKVTPGVPVTLRRLDTVRLHDGTVYTVKEIEIIIGETMLRLDGRMVHPRDVEVIFPRSLENM